MREPGSSRIRSFPPHSSANQRRVATIGPVIPNLLQSDAGGVCRAPPQGSSRTGQIFLGRPAFTLAMSTTAGQLRQAHDQRRSPRRPNSSRTVSVPQSSCHVSLADVGTVDTGCTTRPCVAAPLLSRRLASRHQRAVQEERRTSLAASRVLGPTSPLSVQPRAIQDSLWLPWLDERGVRVASGGWADRSRGAIHTRRHAAAMRG